MAEDLGRGIFSSRIHSLYYRSVSDWSPCSQDWLALFLISFVFIPPSLKSVFLSFLMVITLSVLPSFFFFPGKALKSMSSYFEINVFLPLREERVGELTLPSSTTLRRWNNFPEMFIGIVVCVCAVTLFVQQSTFLLQLIPWTA